MGRFEVTSASSARRWPGSADSRQLGAVAVMSFEQALPTREPPAGGSSLPEKQEIVADPPSAPCRAQCVAGVLIGVMRLLERYAVVVVEPKHVRRPREQLEVGWPQWLLSVRLIQRVEGVSPDSVYICRSTSPQGTFSVHKGIVDNSEVTAPSCTLLRSTVCGKDTSILVLPPSLEASMRKSCDRVR